MPLDHQLLRTFRGKRILVTGGTGSIGSSIVRQLLQFQPLQLRIYSRDESKHFLLQQELERTFPGVDIRYLIGDIRDLDRLNRAMGQIDICFHAAALKHVPYCEYNSFEAIKTNVLGTQNVVDSALANNIDKLITISSDKAVDPNTVMGTTKLLAERIMMGAQHYLGERRTKFSVVRFGNVLKSRGSVVPTWIDQIKNGGPVTVTDKRMERFFMEIDDAVRLVLHAAHNMYGQEIFVLKMPKRNIYDFAREVIAKHGNGKKIEIKITGARQREKLQEQLFTLEEQKTMLEKKSFYIIFPDEVTMQERLDFYEEVI